MSQSDTQSEPPEGDLRYYLRHFLRQGQKLLVYPGAFFYGPARHPPDLKAPTISGDRIPCLTPLLRTPDGADLACFLLPQTQPSLAALSEDECVSYNRRVQRRKERIDQNRRGKEKNTDIMNQSSIDLFSIPPSAKNARATLLMFHGNGTQNWEEVARAREFWEMGCNVLLVSYRGYGFSTGTPSERGLQIDAQTALDYVLNEPYLQTPIILYGFSLGGAVAVHLASQNPSKITALILSNTFTSLPSLVYSYTSLPLLFRLSALLGLCTQKWDSERKMKSVRRETAVFFVSGEKDKLVRPRMAERLWEVIEGRGMAGGKEEGNGKGSGEGRREVGVGENKQAKRRWGWWRGWGCKRKEKAKVKNERKGCVEGLRAYIKKWLRWRSSKMVVDDDHDANVDEDLKPTKDVFIRIPNGTHQNTETFLEYWEAMGRFIQDVTAIPVPGLEDLGAKSTDTSTGEIRRSWENERGDLRVHENDLIRVIGLPR